VYETKAQIYLKAGDRSSGERTLLEALQFAQTLPKAQRPERAVERLQAALDRARQTAAVQVR
jgi:hypothetical protein